MYEKNLNYLFNEVSLYTKEKFEVLNLQDDQYILNKQELDKFLCCIGCAEERLITICHKCKKEFPFSLKKELLELCKKNLAHYAIPKEWEFRKSLPKTIVGKVDFRKLQIENIEKRNKEKNEKKKV